MTNKNDATLTTDDLIQGEILEQLLKQTQKENHQVQCQETAESDNPTETELEELKEKQQKTKQERYKQRKGELCRRYQTEDITPEMVALDDKGWFAQLTLHYYLTVGKPLLKERDKKKVEKLTEHSQGKVFTPDFNRSVLEAKVETLVKYVEIEQFFDTERIFTADSLDEWLKRMIMGRHDLKTVLGISINPEKDSAIAVAQRFLKLLGLKLTCLGQRRENGQRIREYRMETCNPDERYAIFERWLGQ